MSELAVITPFYNLNGYEQPRKNFLKFYDHALKSGVDVFVGEVALDGEDFILPPSDKVFQFRTNSILWYKENIINSVVRRLPSNYEYVAWVDADIIYHDSNWVELVLEQLKKNTLVQLFSECHRLNKDGSINEIRSSFPYWLSTKDNGEPISIPTQGGAWASTREYFQKHGLYDKMILGGGDSVAVYAYYGWWTDTAFNYLSDKIIRHYHKWAYPVHEYVLGRAGHINAVPELLWHGDKINRLYAKRQELLSISDYDPEIDLSYDSNGILTWDSDNTLLHDFVKVYFANRKEDG